MVLPVVAVVAVAVVAVAVVKASVVTVVTTVVSVVVVTSHATVAKKHLLVKKIIEIKKFKINCKLISLYATSPNCTCR